MHHYIPTFDSIDATDRSWLVEMEVDTLTTLDRDCRKGVLGVDGYGDVFAPYEFLWGGGGGWVEGRRLKDLPGSLVPRVFPPRERAWVQS